MKPLSDFELRLFSRARIIRCTPEGWTCSDGTTFDNARDALDHEEDYAQAKFG